MGYTYKYDIVDLTKLDSNFVDYIYTKDFDALMNSTDLLWKRMDSNIKLEYFSNQVEKFDYFLNLYYEKDKDIYIELIQSINNKDYDMLIELFDADGLELDDYGSILLSLSESLKSKDFKSKSVYKIHYENIITIGGWFWNINTYLKSLITNKIEHEVVLTLRSGLLKKVVFIKLPFEDDEDEEIINF